MSDAILLAALGGAMLVAAAGGTPDAVRPLSGSVPALPAPARPLSAPVSPTALTEVVERYCTRCHNERSFRGNLSLVGFDVAGADEHAETAERMIRKLRAGMMPPPGARRPSADTLTALVQPLADIVDETAATRPYAGTRPFQRLNRAEYARVVYDLLGLTVDPEEWLPADQISASFSNGLLTLEIPRSAAAKPKQIPVSTA